MIAVLKLCMTIITQTIGWALAKYAGMTPSVTSSVVLEILQNASSASADPHHEWRYI